MLFKYSTTSTTQNEFDSLPRMSLILKRDNQKIEALGLVDSGASISSSSLFEGDLTLLYQGMKDQVRQVVIRTAGKNSDRNFIKVNIEFVSIN